jgi:hypothetical protein
VSLAALRLGDLSFLFLPGEILEPIGDTLRARSGEKDLLILELCDDGRPAYIPHPDHFSLGGYEVINSRLSPDGVRELMNRAVCLLKENP